MAKAKWVMVSFSNFTKSEPPFFINVTPCAFGWVWIISNEMNVVVDCAMYYNHIPTSELDAKAKADKALSNLLTSPEGIGD